MRPIVTYGRRAGGSPSDAQAAVPGEALVTAEPPPVRLGTLQAGGLAPAMLGLVERGVRLRPGVARELTAEVELSTQEGYPPVRIAFRRDEVVVEDVVRRGPGDRPESHEGRKPDARIHGALADLIALTVSPAVGGVPLPVNARGRAAFGMVVSRRVKVEGSVAVVRRVLALIRV